MALRVEDIDLAADRELVERWQSGDQHAFDLLYRRYFSRLRALCYRRVGDRHAAEEIAQEAFVKALQALPRFGGERRFYPWVSVIASRLCVDHHRRLGRVRPSDDIDPGTVDGDHDRRLAFLADVENLDRALQRLGTRHAEVLELRERQGMTYAEIADHLAVPQSTVETLLFRARKALRREFFAVSGEGKLAALPIVAAIGRRLASMRLKVADRLSDSGPALAQLGSPLAAGAVAVMLAAGPISSTPVTVTAAEAPRVVPMTSVTTSAPTLTPPPEPALVGHDRSGGTRRSDTPPPTPDLPLHAVGSEQARDEASDMPFVLDLGGTGLGVDANEVLDRLFPPDEEDR